MTKNDKKAKRQKNFSSEIVTVIEAAFGNRPMGRQDRTKENYETAFNAVMTYFERLVNFAAPKDVVETFILTMRNHSKNVFDTYAHTENLRPDKALIDYKKQLKRDLKLTRSQIEQNTTHGLAYNHTMIELVDTRVEPNPNAVIGLSIPLDVAEELLERKMLVYSKNGAGYGKLTNSEMIKERNRLKKAAKAGSNGSRGESHAVAG